MECTSLQHKSGHQGITKPSRVNRRRKRKWPDPAKIKLLNKIRTQSSRFYSSPNISLLRELAIFSKNAPCGSKWIMWNGIKWPLSFGALYVTVKDPETKKPLVSACY